MAPGPPAVRRELRPPEVTLPVLGPAYRVRGGSLPERLGVLGRRDRDDHVDGRYMHRGCRFCAVTSGNPHGVLDLDEPKKVAIALAEMDLSYVVLTSVDRDDLSDGGAGHFAKTIREIKTRRPDMLV